ncbi:acyl carrier protein [Streptomyces naphthomycinicus]|uniref:acyl carrier protein n=1 Tax=Streptomyces naphthomycinicus TaxID=2872625 RepID=UPI001CEDCDD7|nr:acyl carrier protein [Streptomyces sp. TML10]
MDNSLDAVIETYAKVVGTSEIRAESDFFEIGGHSLLVMEVIALLRSEYGMTVPARQFLTDARAEAVAAACVTVESE